MQSMNWKFRAKLFVLRFWQPTSACMTCMPGSVGNVLSASHWMVALQTGLATGILVLILSFTPLAWVFRHRYANALVVACLTALGDSYAHPDHYGHRPTEAIVTGVASGLFALVASFVLEDRGRRVRSGWSRLRGHAETPP